MPEITQAHLREMLHYDSDTGVFTWRNPSAKNVKKGGIAGCLTNHGYIQIGVKNKLYAAHRLAWLYVYGKWPTNLIDHINGIRSDNRIFNLREATSVENQYNMSKAKNNTSGVKGVTWSKPHKRWRAQCRVNGKSYHLGLFRNTHEAEQVVRQFREQHHGKFTNHGTPNQSYRWLFLALNRSDYTAKPCRIAVTAPNENSARLMLVRDYMLIFAGRLPAQEVAHA